jgi:hypothetical protein
MAFIRLDEHLTVNTDYVVKVKWKVNAEYDELSASVFLTSTDKNEVVSVRGEAAYKLWDALHIKEEFPRGKLHETGDTLPPGMTGRLRQGW